MYSITHKTAATRLDTCEKWMYLYKSDSKETIKLQKKKKKKNPSKLGLQWKRTASWI